MARLSNRTLSETERVGQDLAAGVRGSFVDQELLLVAGIGLAQPEIGKFPE